jgi:hypothetical protein
MLWLAAALCADVEVVSPPMIELAVSSTDEANVEMVAPAVEPTISIDNEGHRRQMWSSGGGYISQRPCTAFGFYGCTSYSPSAGQCQSMCTRGCSSFGFSGCGNAGYSYDMCASSCTRSCTYYGFSGCSSTGYSYGMCSSKCGSQGRPPSPSASPPSASPPSASPSPSASPPSASCDSSCVFKAKGKNGKVCKKKKCEVCCECTGTCASPPSPPLACGNGDYSEGKKLKKTLMKLKNVRNAADCATECNAPQAGGKKNQCAGFHYKSKKNNKSKCTLYKQATKSKCSKKNTCCTKIP